MSKPFVKLTAAEIRLLVGARLTLKELGDGVRVKPESREAKAFNDAALDAMGAIRRLLEMADLPA